MEKFLIAFCLDGVMMTLNLPLILYITYTEVNQLIRFDFVTRTLRSKKLLPSLVILCNISSNEHEHLSNL